MLKLKAKPLYRTRVGKISARKNGRVPSFIVSSAPRSDLDEHDATKPPDPEPEERDRQQREQDGGGDQHRLRPNRSDSAPIRKMKPM